MFHVVVKKINGYNVELHFFLKMFNYKILYIYQEVSFFLFLFKNKLNQSRRIHYFNKFDYFRRQRVEKKNSIRENNKQPWSLEAISIKKDFFFTNI